MLHDFRTCADKSWTERSETELGDGDEPLAPVGAHSVFRVSVESGRPEARQFYDVLRRFSQFGALHEALAQLGCVGLPELPPKNWLPGEWAALGLQANRSPVFVGARCVALGAYLRTVLHLTLTHPQLGAMHAFLAADASSKQIEAWHADPVQKHSAPSAPLALENTGGAKKSKAELVEQLHERAGAAFLKEHRLYGRPAAVVAGSAEAKLLDATKALNALLATGEWSDHLCAEERVGRDFDKEEAEHNRARIKQIEEVFDRIDGNGDGLMQGFELKAVLKDPAVTQLRDELAEMLRDSGVDPGARDAFGQLDVSGDGLVSKKEFLAAVCEELAVFKIFDEIDSDKNGSLDKDELKVLQKKAHFMEIFESLGGSLDDSLFEQLDTDGDGVVTWAEFKTALKGYRQALVMDAGK
jgi:Ca2+-binding EF-hand superfamily protein